MTTTSSDGERRVGFTLPGDPIPAPRPRFRVIKLPGGKSTGSAYYAGKYKRYAKEAPKAIPESPIYFDKGTPVVVYVTFFIGRPKKPVNKYPVGDLDNYVKAILDVITKNGTYWHDDAQVVYVNAVKSYTNEEPRTDVSISERRMPCEK